MTLLKALPFSYNRDLSEDKRAAFDAVDSLAVVLPAMTGMVRTLQVDVDVLRGRRPTASRWRPKSPTGWRGAACRSPQAHEITGALVRRCEDRGIELAGADGRRSRRRRRAAQRRTSART